MTSPSFTLTWIYWGPMHGPKEDWKDGWDSPLAPWKVTIKHCLVYTALSKSHGHGCTCGSNWSLGASRCHGVTLYRPFSVTVVSLGLLYYIQKAEREGGSMYIYMVPNSSPFLGPHYCKPNKTKKSKNKCLFNLPLSKYRFRPRWRMTEVI